MTRDSLQNIDHIVLKCLALSLFLHIIVIGSFIFVFPLISESHKPQIVFLGPILKGSDTGHSHVFKAKPDLPDPVSEKLFQHTGTTSVPYARKLQEKPHQPKSIKEHRKINMKSIFDTSYSPQKRAQDSNLADELKKAFEQEQYNPLSLPQ